MDMILNILNQVYSANGFKFNKTFTVPVINQKLAVDVIITAKSPSKWSLTYNNGVGSLVFDGGPSVHIPRVFLNTTLTSIDFKGTEIVIHSSGCPAIHYDLKDL